MPFTLKAKLLVRELMTTDGENERKLGWDEAMPQYKYDRWRELFKELYELEALTFHRCMKPEDAVDKPVLVIFADASKLAYGACAYLRWKVREGPFVSKLLISKNRSAPTRQLTIPRLEMCGAVLACRLRTMIEKEIDIELESVIHITNSSIVRAQICNRSSSFNVFVATREAEIQTKSKSEEWFCTSSGNNPADLTTRPTHPVLLDSNSSCVDQRISVWLKNNWNMSVFILLPGNHSFTVLDVKYIHEIDHAGVEATFAKLQSKFWVPGARKLIKSVNARCVICRTLAKKSEG